MKAILAIAVLMGAYPLAAEELTTEQTEVIAGVDAFFAALASDDKTALARQMIPEGMIFVHNRMDPNAPRVDIVPVADHLARWAKGTAKVEEPMRYDTVRVDGDMAQVWGPYRFIAGGRTRHCGINSMSLVKRADGWKVANTSFTMERPGECQRLGAPEVPAQ